MKCYVDKASSWEDTQWRVFETCEAHAFNAAQDANKTRFLAYAYLQAQRCALHSPSRRTYEVERSLTQEKWEYSDYLAQEDIEETNETYTVDCKQTIWNEDQQAI